MGKKTLYISIGLNALAALMGCVGMVLPFHRLSFYTGPPGYHALLLLRMITYVVTCDADTGSSDICTVLNIAKDQAPALCKTPDPGTASLYEVADRFCAPGVQRVLPNACTGLSFAWGFGITITILFFLNLILQVLAVFLTWEYLHKRPKKKYRKVAMILLYSGSAALLVFLLLYGILVFLNLNNIMPKQGMQALVSAGRAPGPGVGYILVCVSQLVQVAAAVMYQTKTSDEKNFEDARMEAEFDSAFQAEMACSQAGYGHQQPQWGSGGQQWGSGGQHWGSGAQPWGSGGTQWGGGDCKVMNQGCQDPYGPGAMAYGFDGAITGQVPGGGGRGHADAQVMAPPYNWGGGAQPLPQSGWGAPQGCYAQQAPSQQQRWA